MIGSDESTSFNAIIQNNRLSENTTRSCTRDFAWKGRAVES